MPDRLTRLSDLALTRVAFVAAGDNPEAHVTLWKAAPGTTEWDLALKRSFTKEQRDRSSRPRARRSR